jgi:hypothetical protein
LELLLGSLVGVSFQQSGSNMSYIRRDMLKFLTSRVENLEGLYGFSRTNGFGQSYGKGEDINRLYGEWVTNS